MCVKEFLGYNCGHCSIPYLRQCPLTESNEMYPPCKFPAERPIFTNENCHACARVLWNKKVLDEEAKHRELHENGLCQCEVIFDSEERGRRMRPRGAKGKGKLRELVGGNTHGHDYDISSTGEGSGTGYQGRYRGGDRSVKQDNKHAIGGESSRQDQAWEAKLAAYEYVGYFTGIDSQGGALAHVEQGYGFPEGGYVRKEQLWEGQLLMGQPGSGMKWYPEQGPPTLPTLPALPPLPSSMPFAGRAPRTWQRASSEPTEGNYRASPRVVLAELAEMSEPTENPVAEQAAEEFSGPVVVSSEMANSATK
ncbi:uncharacterized protein LY89DRAFT_762333 [Mollisia scopiformis]|uniref:Uncharacterized protein n=1 Tax=Mollisia scopiformis TaxID=149040 RepID=A0A194XQF1_MOLSC|nr:uncharacterized protein LY89DRAFT_762333 [Mollisia scopiformis]KUJ22284.1 hypothetical protein LY89DRAFT_762333 [Mollisia scopiformis]